jgi:glucuronate isomerase
MKEFLGPDFLLDTATAQHLYHEHAEPLPIIDYHCHLSPQQIAEDHRFRSITELWLSGDHYKWRAMRANGVSERYITGDATDRDKFHKWAETVPYTLRNPLYHWTHLELRTAFGITETLNPESADRIYDRCNELLADPSRSARGLMKLYHVEAVCTTDDPTDTLEYHEQIRQSGFEVKVLPAWRPDKAMAVADSAAFRAYLIQLGEAAGLHIATYDDLLRALQIRHDYFAAHGCTVADHGVTHFPGRRILPDEVRQIFLKGLNGLPVGRKEAEGFQTELLLELCRMNHAKGWVQQFHYGPLRNVNTRARLTLGPDTGFDTIGDDRSAESIAHFLDALDRDDQLAKTILYNINPADNTWLAAMIANFQDGRTPGKIQMGSGWWFNDQLRGMEDQLNALSLQGLLSRFVGMLTDSRSFVSYPRHEYFRRLLCRLVGRDVEEGLIPQSEMPRVEQMIEDISYRNAQRYFDF